MSHVFALRHKSTGRFLPRPPSGQKGGSWVEPTPPDKTVPRFFPTIGVAKGFLTQWLKGPVVVQHSLDYTGDDYISWENHPERSKEPRIRDEWEVVTIYWGVKE